MYVSRLLIFFDHRVIKNLQETWTKGGLIGLNTKRRSLKLNLMVVVSRLLKLDQSYIQRLQFFPILGRPLCTIIDQRPFRFTSLCHLIKYLKDESLFHRVLQVQKGDCADASKLKVWKHCFKMVQLFSDL